MVKATRPAPWTLYPAPCFPALQDCLTSFASLPLAICTLHHVLSKGEVKRILSAPMNEKHRVMLSLIYGCGLRRSELIILEPQDIDRDRMLLSIRQSKGFKDRVVPV